LKDHTRKLLDKAARAIRVASLLVDNGETEFAMVSSLRLIAAEN
jgi:hypothetical protein